MWLFLKQNVNSKHMIEENGRVAHSIQCLFSNDLGDDLLFHLIFGVFDLFCFVPREGACPFPTPHPPWLQGCRDEGELNCASHGELGQGNRQSLSLSARCTRPVSLVHGSCCFSGICLHIFGLAGVFVVVVCRWFFVCLFICGFGFLLQHCD